MTITATDLIVSLILISGITTGLFLFAGSIFTNYSVTLSDSGNQSLTNISGQTVGVIGTANDIYSNTMDTSNDVGLLSGVVVWVGSSVTALKTAVLGVGMLSNVGGVLGTNIGVDSIIAGVIILAVIIIVIMSFVAVMLGRERV
jgi:hypothetical protein